MLPTVSSNCVAVSNVQTAGTAEDPIRSAAEQLDLAGELTVELERLRSAAQDALAFTN